MNKSRSERIGRNDPCPCGSGKKWKQCCGRPKAPVRVLYVHPAKQGADMPAGPVGRPYGLIPVGLAALVNLLQENDIPVEGINLPLEKQLDPRFDLRTWLKGRPAARVILIDMHWYEHTYGAIDVARACKQALPEAWTVLGGLSASAFAADILAAFPAVDYVIRGDAEVPLLRLVQGLLSLPGRSARPAHAERLRLDEIPNLSWHGENGVIENSLTYCAAAADLDRLNFVDLDFLAHRDEYYVHEYVVPDLQRARSAPDPGRFRGRWLCSARGCRYECSYCGGCRSAQQTLAGRQGIVPRSAECLVDDMRRLASQRVIQASLSYDVAEMGEAYWRLLFSLLRQSGVRIGLYNEFFQMPPAEFVTDFARSVDLNHSCLALSPLSGSERVRRLNGKGYDNQAFFALLDTLRRHRISIFVYFSLNLPGEDEQTILESVDMARRIVDGYPSHLVKILTSAHTIDPLCRMSTHADEYGIDVDMRSFMDYYEYCRKTGLNSPESRTEVHRGFRPRGAADGSHRRRLERMADIWDAGRVGHESSWWPVPPGW